MSLIYLLNFEWDISLIMKIIKLERIDLNNDN